MILNSKVFVVGVARNVEHVLDPVGAVGNLEFVPIDSIVLESSVPVEAKSQDFHIETILHTQVVDHETCMDQAGADLHRRGMGTASGRGSLNKGNRISFRILKPE